jgi:hypothetical protein
MRVAVLILLPLLLLGSPVWGQTDAEIEKLIAGLGDQDDGFDLIATEALMKMGSAAIPALTKALDDPNPKVRRGVVWLLREIGLPAIPALIKALDDPDQQVRNTSVSALGKSVRDPGPAIPALIKRLDDPAADLRRSAEDALGGIGFRIKAQGTVLWWVVPRVYWKQIFGLLLLLVVWFTVMARSPRYRPESTPKHLALVALTAAIPAWWTCVPVHHAITRDWAQGFLPDTLTLVPFPVAALLSTALAVTLPAIWVCQRKSVAPVEELGA